MAINNLKVKNQTQKLLINEEIKEIKSNLEETTKLLRNFENGIRDYYSRIGVSSKILVEI